MLKMDTENTRTAIWQHSESQEQAPFVNCVSLAKTRKRVTDLNFFTPHYRSGLRKSV